MQNETRINTCPHCGKYDWACPGAAVFRALDAHHNNNPDYALIGDYDITADGIMDCASDLARCDSACEKYKPDDLVQYVVAWLMHELNEAQRQIQILKEGGKVA